MAQAPAASPVTPPSFLGPDVPTTPKALIPNSYGYFDPAELGGTISAPPYSLSPSYGFTAQNFQTLPDGQRAVGYVSGDEWMGTSFSPDQIMNIQNAMDSANILNGTYLKGTWDQTTASAFARILASANSAGLPWSQVLGQYLAQAPPKSGSGGPAAITDADIQSVANKTAQGLLGRNLRSDEMTQFIPAFRGSYGGGTSPTTAGADVLRSEVAPVETGGYAMGQAMQTIDKLLRGGTTTMSGG